MGILTDAFAILLGGLFGGRWQKSATAGSHHGLGIGIMLVSLVGFLENVYNVREGKIVSEHLLVVLFAFLIGNKVGELIRLEDRLSHVGSTKSTACNAFLDATLFFGVGGLQISGPLLLALHGDSTQLFIKSIVDLPFAVAFGAAYGRIVALSALPVAGMQGLIALIACAFSAFFSDELTAQLCAMGYLILFFSGFNLMTDGKYKVSNTNMLPGILLILLFHGTKCILGGI